MSHLSLHPYEYLHNRKKKRTLTARELRFTFFFGDSIIKEKNIEIPHTRMQDRRFVLVPASEIAANYLHPILRKTIKELLAECNDNTVVKIES